METTRSKGMLRQKGMHSNML